MRRLVSLTATAVAAGLVLTACGFGGDDDGGGGDSASGGSTTLDLLVPQYSDGTTALWEEIIASFEEANPDVTVNLEVQSWDNINDVIRTKVQAGEAPDILNIDAFSGFAKDDLLYPADEVVSEDTFGDFQESFVENASLDGTVYGLPMIASARALFYNEDVLAQAGITEPPATWDDLLAAGTAVAGLGTGVFGYGMPLGSEEAQAETSIWTFGGGGSWTDGDAITVDTPENLAAVEFMKQMIDAGATQPDPGATDRTPMLDVFIQGSIAMAVGLPPTIGQIEERNPELNYGIAPVPTQDGSPVTLGVADHLMAFRNDDDKQEAITAFLDHFFSTDVYLSFVDTEGFLPTTKSGAEGTANAERFADFLALLPDAQFYPSTNEAWAATQGALQSLVGQIQTQDAASVLQQIQASADNA
ncbi:extracellular solute-binding protein [Jiangella sp. DSM 45060]|uniref:extracellular solute-binding protein n=1 Tax=Jiangella sp. DSM 45060 TaxID=1798224 RepID=UPI00087D2D19|nr:extracellular solute-binding protein [Jiangella sp. DSM 45060]SDT63478.1 carbohydrate ABC transporter substrate-binding protein, CUT1 family [Jiangella sp. DSM 45060]